MFFYNLLSVTVEFPEGATGELSKNTFLTEQLQTTASVFVQTDIHKFKECQSNESTEKIHTGRKKAKHGTEGNKLKC